MKVKEYIELSDRSEINTMLRYSQVANIAIDTLGIGKVDDWPFDDVKQMQLEINNMNFFRAIYWLDKLGVKNIGQRELIKTIQCYNYLVSEIKRSIELENELLGGDTEIDYIAAGIEQLEELGSYLQMRQIAKGLNLKINEVKQMKYSDALLELVAQKRIQDFEKRLQEIRLKKLTK